MQDSPQVYIRTGGEELGPLSVNDIKKMIDGGLFNPDDFIRLTEEGVWVKAGNVKHLKALFEEPFVPAIIRLALHYSAAAKPVKDSGTGSLQVFHRTGYSH